MEDRYKKSKGNAGLEGVQFQLDLLTVFSLNALRSCRDWKISSENEEAGKYDDLVLELPSKNVFLQAKHKQSKKITRGQLFSSNSKNADFSLPKYFFSYLEIRSKDKETSVTVCTNTDVNQKGLQAIVTSHRVESDSLLHYDGATCPYFTFNKNILPELRESAECYLEKNLQGKSFDKALITDKNIEEFLRNFQFFYNYPSGEELHQVIERLLCRLDGTWRKTTYHEIHQKVEEWFKQPKGEYLTESRANAMLCEIRSQEYCNSLKDYNISFERNDFDFSNSNRIIHIKTNGRCLLQMLRLFEALQNSKTKQLYLNPKEDIEMREYMVEAFGFPQYSFLIIVWQENRDRAETLEITTKLKEILEKNPYKKIVLLANDVTEVAQLLELTEISEFEGSMTFPDFSKGSQDRLLKNKNIVFQGERVSLEELLKTKMTDDYRKSLDMAMLEELVRGGEIKIGERLTDLDEGVAQYYVHRTFEREVTGKGKKKTIIPEESLFDISENVVLISDSAGMGKSTTLTKMAACVKQNNPRMWVIKINLMDYTIFLRDCVGKSRQTITIDELMNSQQATKLKNRFEEFVFHMNVKVVLLFDGVDEIAPNYSSLIIQLLQQCQEATNITKVFATTRPHMTDEIRAVLNVGSFKMLPFTRHNQIECLINYWAHNLQLKDVNEKRKCARYAELLIDKISLNTESYLYEEVPIGAIPLQVRMIADIFQEKSTWVSKDWESCSEFLKGTEKDPKLPEKFDMTNLYDMFIDKKRDVFVDKGNPTGNTAAYQALVRQFEECLAHHRSLALKVILTESDCKLFSTYREHDSRHVLKIGIVHINGETIFFVHRTFAEYFVAVSILEELQLGPSLKFQKFFLDDILVKYEFAVVRGFLDSCLQKHIGSLSPDTFAKYRSHACEVNFNLIFKLAEEGRVAILQLILKIVQFKIIRGKIFNIKDWHTVSGDRTVKRLKYLKTVTQEPGVNLRDQYGCTPLHHSAESCHLEMVKFLIGQGADVNVKDVNNVTPLLAATTGNCELNTVKCIVENGASVNDRDGDGRTALHWAAVRGMLDTVRYLMERDTNVTERDNDGSTVLHWAVEGGRLEVVKYLVECGASVNDRGNDGRSVLHWAAEMTELDVVKYIVESGADVNDRNNDGCTALHSAVAEAELDVIKYVVGRGASVNDRDGDGRTALHWAVSRGELDITRYIVLCGANVNDRDHDGRTALHWAVERNELDTIKYVVECGANVNDRDNEDSTALHWVARGCRLSTLEYLIQCGANVHDRSRDGCTVLHWSVDGDKLDAIKYIVECGANVNGRSDDGRTVLHWAIERGRLFIIKYLVEQGANVNDKDGEGRNAFHFAIERGEWDIIKYVVGQGADINDRNDDGLTALHWAAKKGRLEVVKHIVECGASVNARSNDGRTALHWATVSGRLDIIKYVVECGGNVEDRDGSGLTAAELAQEMERVDNIKYLEAFNEDVDNSDSDGCCCCVTS